MSKYTIVFHRTDTFTTHVQADSVKAAYSKAWEMLEAATDWSQVAWAIGDDVTIDNVYKSDDMNDIFKGVYGKGQNQQLNALMGIFKDVKKK